MARELKSESAGPATGLPSHTLRGLRGTNPLNRTREPSMGRLALVPLGAAALFAAAAWGAHERTQDRRMDAVARAVVANGHTETVRVEPIRGDECGRAREGFRWEAAGASGRACAGPGGEVRLMSQTVRPASQETR